MKNSEAARAWAAFFIFSRRLMMTQQHLNGAGDNPANWGGYPPHTALEPDGVLFPKLETPVEGNLQAN